jgi:hypothetical protein
MTIMVRRRSGTPSASSKPGKRVAPTRLVAPQFTKAIAASEAGIKPTRQSTSVSQVGLQCCAQTSSRARISKVAVATTPI